MNLPALHVTALLRQHGLRPDKALGQNFLHDPTALEKIVQAAEISSEDTVLEIGPGAGSLTRYLALAARQVIAVELDTDLVPILREVLAAHPNTYIVQGDILHLSPAELALPEGYLVVANIPYYITSAIFRHLLETQPRPRRIVLTIQKEVAERICAAPGAMSLLALSVQVYGKPSIVARIPAGAFYPVPKVDSAVIRVELYPEPLIPPARLERFFQLARAGFSQKRKTLRNSLSAGLRISPSEAAELLRRAGLDGMRRAETLSLEEWRILAEL
ncbi:MAG: 16S rRNA (adenine(1518)-N(6)/adenine(1519)-N(6))-dimethyltransferase RsmA [Anaerolineales bacterium]|nr:16S rRNA (adenine(1518)-N(6)/adenine(1519)-N(6))-dimethyltransferase RsmA [Anaerolineales bacterium]MCX7754584.1 16S rRNA (adenine(1518)-N(6)/adenine(1519)-N(6))-dimethyltransferase RsmA [Anaerolineales bacterium]MDW8277177.1 16S rRNA (adenine(1518)-N(6)/adenine(1519)-N(6))-dimethyltransferase RsmA [Anaerolineales bacterium]